MRGIVVAACIGVIGLATPVLADGWKEIDELRSRFYVSILPAPRYGETGWNESFSSRAYRAVKFDQSASDPRMELYYFELAPGRFFPSVPTPGDQVTRFNYLKSGFVKSGEEQHFARRLRFRYITGSKGTRSCVVFVGATGDGAGDGQISAGTAYISGYYCDPAGQPIDAARTELVLASIGTKEVGTAGPGASIDRAASKEALPLPSNTEPPTSATATPSDIERALSNAKNLYEKKLISEDEYSAMRKKILGLR